MLPCQGRGEAYRLPQADMALFRERPVLGDDLPARDGGKGKVMYAASLRHVPASPGYHHGIVAAERELGHVEGDLPLFGEAGELLADHTVSGHTTSHDEATRLELLHGPAGLEGERFGNGEEVGCGGIAEFLRGEFQPVTGRRFSGEDTYCLTGTKR